MVKFLLHNTLGAWWAGRVLAAKPDLAHDAEDEHALRNECALPGVAWEYLRFVREDEGKGPLRPAGGTFPGWPQRASEITFCDPCCGSGHFLVEAFAILAAMRQAEERLSPEDAARTVLRDNLAWPGDRWALCADRGIQRSARSLEVGWKPYNAAAAAHRVGRCTATDVTG